MKKYLVLTALAAALSFQTASAAHYKKRHSRYKRAAVAAAPAAAGAAAAAASAPEQAASAPEDGLPDEPKPQAAAAPEIAAAAYLVQDLPSGQILTGREFDKPVQPAPPPKPHHA